MCVCVGVSVRKSENEETKTEKESSPTGDGESVAGDLGSDLDASSPLGVICPTQTRDIGHTPLVDVHHTV